MDRRILFAEFVGKCHEFKPTQTVDGNYNVITKAGCRNCGKGPHADYDAENNDTDCMALCDVLIRETCGQVHIIKSTCKNDAVEIRDKQWKLHTWAGNGNWKQGVCDLAEPIVRKAMKDDD